VNTPRVADRARPGDLLRLVADGLARSGLNVHTPEDAESRCVTIILAGAQCTPEVTDYGCARWEYCPWPPGQADPDLTADLATVLLTGHAGPFPRLGRRHQSQNITFKAIVGLELRARGLDVELMVYRDEDYFDAFAEIMATAPGAGCEAKVCVTDDGSLTWTREYGGQAAAVLPGPGLCGRVADPAGVAAAVAESVTRAVSYLPPGRQGSAQ
jgi:hypothetical protein